VTGEKVCPQCGARYGAALSFCATDGATLMAAEPSDELIGSIVADRYRVVSRVGTGGMGEVFLAEHVRIKRKCALKVMRRSMITDSTAVMRFNREAENASQISHPNVAAVYDFGETANGLIYLAMEFVDGEPLSDTLARERALTPVRVSEIVRQAADALSVAHQVGILHRDLKPDNIMLSPTRTGTDLVKIVDFGIARVIGSEAQSVTSTGIAVGTPDFMSPEQFAGEKLDQRSDIYSLALVAFNLLSGELAFPSPTSTDHLLARFTSKPRTLSSVRPSIEWPQELQNVFDKALASDPEERYDDVIDFALDLGDGIALMPPSTEEHEYLAALATRRTTPSRPATPITPTAGFRTPRYTPAVSDDDLDGDTVTVPAGAGEASSEEEESELEAATTATRTAYAPQSLEIAQVPRPGRRRIGAVLGGLALVVAGGTLWANWAGDDGRSAVTLPPHPVVPVESVLAQMSYDTLAPRAISEIASARPFTVMGVRSGEREGVAVVVDRAAGLLLTSSRFVNADSTVDVRIDGSRAVRGRVVATDAANGLAVVAIAARRCTNCQTGAVSAQGLVESSGDSVALFSVSRSTLARVDGVSDTALSLSESPPALGSPVLSSRGELVGLATGSSTREARIVPSALFSSVIGAAAARIAASPPTLTDSVSPIWPETPYRSDRLDDVTNDGALSPYRARGSGVDVLVMTPPVAAYRERQRRQDLELQTVGSLRAREARPADPIMQWDGWSRAIDQRQAVVIVDAVADTLRFPDFLNIREPIQSGRSVASVRLLRNGEPVEDLTRSTFPAVADPEPYRARNLEILSQGLAVYRAEQFLADDNGGPAGTLEFEVRSANGGGTVRIPVPASVIERIRRDFRGILAR
jgi:serine/threonine-protein kinase